MTGTRFQNKCVLNYQFETTKQLLFHNSVIVDSLLAGRENVELEAFAREFRPGCGQLLKQELRVASGVGLRARRLQTRAHWMLRRWVERCGASHHNAAVSGGRFTKERRAKLVARRSLWHGVRCL